MPCEKVNNAGCPGPSVSGYGPSSETPAAVKAAFGLRKALGCTWRDNGRQPPAEYYIGHQDHRSAKTPAAQRITAGGSQQAVRELAPQVAEAAVF
jgi:hypothetical protein